MRGQTNSQTGARQIRTAGIFKGWSTPDGELKILENSNGTRYAWAKVETTLEGKTFETDALIFENNILHENANIEVGNSYLLTVSEGVQDDDDRLYFQMSHLPASRGLTKKDVNFDSLFNSVEDTSDSTVVETVSSVEELESEDVESQL